MRRLASFVAAGLLAGGVVVATSGPAYAGIFQVTVSGAPTCNTTTGQYDIVWTITSTQASSGGTVNSATQTPPTGGQALTVTPNPVPGNSSGSSTATSSLPGNTTGAVTLVVDVAGIGPDDTGVILLDGACTIAAAPVTASPRLTG